MCALSIDLKIQLIYTKVLVVVEKYLKEDFSVREIVLVLDITCAVVNALQNSLQETFNSVTIQCKN